MRKQRANKSKTITVIDDPIARRAQVPLPDEARGIAVLDQRPRVHVLGLPHTIVSEAFSHCAFTGKVLRMPLVLPDYRVIEYSNGHSESKAAEHVQIFSAEHLIRLSGGSCFRELQEACTSKLCHDTELQAAWFALVIRELRKRLRAGDVIAVTYPFEGYSKLVQQFPDCVCIESGIGYGAPGFGAYRVFESETWRAWHFGRYVGDNGSLGTWPKYEHGCCSAVVPNYYDVEQWAIGDAGGMNRDHEPQPCPLGGERSPYVFFAGRMLSSKGIEIVNTLAERNPDLTFVVASGDAFIPERFPAKNVKFIGRVDSRKSLAAWYGGALCTLMPTRYHEPFGGVAVESLLCGTPVICSDWAAFTETVRGVDHRNSAYANNPAGDGMRCNDLYEFEQGLKHLLATPEWNALESREARRTRAQERFGLEPVSERYRAAIEMFRRMHAEGLRP